MNKNDQAQIIQPAQKIALLSVTERPRMVIKYVDEIEKIEWKTRDNGKKKRGNYYTYKEVKKIAPRLVLNYF